MDNRESILMFSVQRKSIYDGEKSLWRLVKYLKVPIADWHGIGNCQPIAMDLKISRLAATVM